MDPVARHARPLALLALVLGVAGDALLRATPPGLGAALWGVTCAATALVARRAARRVGLAVPAMPLLLAGALALGIAWRDSPILQALFAAAALGAGVAALLDRPARAGVPSWAAATIGAMTSAVLGPLLVLAGVRGAGAPTRVGWRVGLAGALAAAPLLLVFGTLFASADPLFAEYAADVARSIDEALGHAGTALAIAWLAGGALAGLALARCPADLRLGRPRAWIVDAGAVAVALVVVLFAAFLVVQARALFGGRELVEATVGLGYADYARRGFFQLLAAAGIALPLALGADAAAAPGEPRRARMVALSCALVGMVLAVLASAARRMILYVDAYGLSELRLYASAAMLWLAVAFVVFAIGAAAGRRGFPARALALAAAVVVLLGALSPQAVIVRVNAARAAAAPAGFDAAYATSLGADAVPALLAALPALPPAPRCAVARDLAARAERPVDGDWRSWTLSGSRVRALLREARDELDATARACPPAAGAAAARDQRPA